MDKKLIEKLNRCRGNIIADATRVEIALDFELRFYFFPKTNAKASAFHGLILDSGSFSFDKKVSLYEEIPYFKRLKRYVKVKGALRFIQRFRNAVAHWPYTLGSDRNTEKNIILYNVNLSKQIRLDANSVSEFKKHVDFVLKSFGFREQSTWEF